MNRIVLVPSSADTQILSATTAAFPPVTGAAVPTAWGNAEKKVVPQFDIKLIAAGAASITDLKVYGAIPISGTIADTVFTSTHASDLFTAASHGMITGDGPVRVSSSGTLPAGLAASTDYWVIWVSANTFKLAASFADAMAGTVVATTSDGTGTHTLEDTSSTMLMRWHLHGLAEAAVTLSSIREGYTVRCNHNTRVTAYGLVWTGTAANAITATVSPVSES